MNDQTQIVGYLEEKDITKRLDIHESFYLLLLVKYKVRSEFNKIASKILLNGLINLSKGSGGGLQSLNPLNSWLSPYSNALGSLLVHRLKGGFLLYLKSQVTVGIWLFNDGIDAYWIHLLSPTVWNTEDH